MLLLLVWVMQLTAFILMELQHAAIGEHGKSTEVLIARIVSILILGTYSMMAGQSQNGAIRCSVFDAVHKNNKTFYWFMFFPIFQALIELVELRVSVDVILEAPTVVEVFKDAMSFVIILEIDNWVAFAVNKRTLGLTNEMFLIDFYGDSSLSDEIISGLIYGLIVVAKIAILIWDIYHEVEHTLKYADTESTVTVSDESVVVYDTLINDLICFYDLSLYNV